MNLMYLKYAVEVARLGSINKAAEQLFVAQPNLSRYIKNLETELGIVIFKRTSRGMTLTPDGETFVRYAAQVLNQIDDIERMYKGNKTQTQRFSISVPRASYIADAFVRFSCRLKMDPAEIVYMETNSQMAIRNILNSDYRLGIIRYAVEHEEYFAQLLREKNLSGRLISEFTYELIMSRDNEIAKKEKIYWTDLNDFIEITHGDPYLPLMTLDAMHCTVQEQAERRILLFERGGQFDLLCENKQTYMWVSPLPPHLLTRYSLVQRKCEDNKRVYRDMLVRNKNYQLTKLDEMFLEELKTSKKNAGIG